MKILDLSLTYHWYDEILAGKKPEEYRKDSPFYKARLMTGYEKHGAFNCDKHPCTECNAYKIGLCEPVKYDAVRFHRGQGGRTTMLVEYKGWKYGYGNTNWGAPLNIEVNIIRLGRLLEA